MSCARSTRDSGDFPCVDSVSLTAALSLCAAVAQEAFIDVCYMNNLGIGVHPQRRIELVKSKALAKGHRID